MYCVINIRILVVKKTNEVISTLDELIGAIFHIRDSKKLYLSA